MKKFFELLNTISQEKLIAILRVDDASIADQAIFALKKGGVRLIEVTMNVPDVLTILSKNRQDNDILLGAGTVLDEVSCRLAILNGAEFIVTPCFNDGVIRTANRYQKPVICGCMTASEIVRAMECGVHLIKLFPADVLTPSYFDSIAAPLPQVCMGPTGGVSLDNIQLWAQHGAAFFAVSGQISKLANEGRFAELTELARSIREKINDSKL